MKQIFKHRLLVAAAFFTVCFFLAMGPSQPAGADAMQASSQQQAADTACCNCTTSDFCNCNLVSGFQGCTVSQTPEGRDCTTTGWAQCLVQKTQN